MESIVTKFVYRIEPDPAGGFIARPSDPSLEPIEGATREEVQQKIQAKITEMIQSQLPTELKLGPLHVKINRKVTVTTCSTTTPAANVQLPSTQNLATQNTLDATAPSSERISTILRVAAGVLAVVAIIYYLLHR